MQKAPMANVIVLNRDYPLPGGRSSLIKNLVKDKQRRYIIMTRTKEGHNLMKVRCLTNHLIEYHLRTFFMLVFMNQKKIIFGSGIKDVFPLRYIKFFGCKKEHLYTTSSLSKKMPDNAFKRKVRKSVNMTLTAQESNLIDSARAKIRQSLAAFVAKSCVEYSQKVLE